ncbi:MAG: family 2 glycosyl transferase, partial [Patescibacteria group bacterium]|nr:family 2 glycosyl transferase [Patescibacteria group bacterium]
MLHCPMLHPSILMDKEIFTKIGMYDPNFIHAEDYELYFRAMFHNYKFGNIPEYLVYIREGKHSRSRGEEWKTQRRYYIKAKNKAMFQYGFNKYYDIFYHIFTPFSYFVSPRIALKIKRLTGWYKND